MNKPMMQIMVGLLLSMTCAAGIIGRSWGAAGGFILLSAFWYGGIVALSDFNAAHALRRKVARSLMGIYAAAFLAAGLSFAERMYFVNGEGYPPLLATGDLGYLTLRQLYASPGPKCEGKGGEYINKDAGMVVFRCGSIFWLNSHTYLAHIVEDQK